MEILKKGTAIGKIMAKRVKGYPVFEEPPKVMPKKKPTCWVIMPAFTAALPKTLTEVASEKNYSFTAHIFSTTREEAETALDHLIRCAQEEIEAGNKRFWLHAVKHSIRHTDLFKGRLTYIFRARQIPEEISKEVK